MVDPKALRSAECSVRSVIPDDKVRGHLDYLKYWTLSLTPLMVYNEVLFPPNFIIKETYACVQNLLDLTCSPLCSAVTREADHLRTAI